MENQYKMSVDVTYIDGTLEAEGSWDDLQAILVRTWFAGDSADDIVRITFTRV